MARLRFETAPEITINDEAAVFKAANGASAPVVEFRAANGSVMANIAANGVLNVTSVIASVVRKHIYRFCYKSICR
jgi:hypothetical protein